MNTIRLNFTITQSDIVSVLNKLPKGARKETIELALLLFIRSDAGNAYLSCKGVKIGYVPDREMVQKDETSEEDNKNNEVNEIVPLIIGQYEVN